MEEQYIHRCGRAGRQFKGESVCFYQDQDRAVLDRVHEMLVKGNVQTTGYSTSEEVAEL